jgi:hypothetical protein
MNQQEAYKFILGNFYGCFVLKNSIAIQSWNSLVAQDADLMTHILNEERTTVQELRASAYLVQRSRRSRLSFIAYLRERNIPIPPCSAPFNG